MGVLRIGLVYDVFGDAEKPDGAPPDWDVEYEPERTVKALEHAVRRLNHVAVRVGNVPALLAAIKEDRLEIDAAINISESYGSRNREAHAPILLELAGIPCIGSDALALSATLDKHLAKLVARQTGLKTPDWSVVRSVEELDLADLPAFPVFVKPRYEGTAKGISPLSKCHNAEELLVEVGRQLRLYDQDVIVEQFVEGGEFTVGVVGHDPPEALPVLQHATERETGIGLHAIESHEDNDAPFDYNVGMELDSGLEFGLQRDALRIHEAMECLDFSRSDFRVDEQGQVWFLEINPLPTFAPDDTFAILAELLGKPYDAFLADVLVGALQRVGV